MKVNNQWHKWFAWYPVQTKDKKEEPIICDDVIIGFTAVYKISWRWLVSVERSVFQNSDGKKYVFYKSFNKPLTPKERDEQCKIMLESLSAEGKEVMKLFTEL